MDRQLGLRGTYNPSLRTRSVWKVIGPVLTASSDSITEDQTLQSTDFNFLLEGNSPPLQVLLLSPSSLLDSEKQNTCLRLRQFAASDPTLSASKAAACLLSEDAFTRASGKSSLNGLLALQVFVFETLTNALPVISISDAPSFFSSIHQYMVSLEKVPVASPSLADSVALLGHATSDPSSTLDQQTINILSDLFPSFRNLSVESRQREGQGLLSDYFVQSTSQGITRFWCKDVVNE